MAWVDYTPIPVLTGTTAGSTQATPMKHLFWRLRWDALGVEQQSAHFRILGRLWFFWPEAAEVPLGEEGEEEF
jgi:hypothetical protein